MNKFGFSFVTLFILSIIGYLIYSNFISNTMESFFPSDRYYKITDREYVDDKQQTYIEEVDEDYLDKDSPVGKAYAKDSCMINKKIYPREFRADEDALGIGTPDLLAKPIPTGPYTQSGVAYKFDMA